MASFRRGVVACSASVLVLCVVLPACGSSTLLGTESVGEPGFLDRLTARVEAARDQAQWQLRHNPVRVACPPWELRLANLWHRVQLLEGEETDAMAQLEAAVVRETEERPMAWRVEGELDDDVSACARGAVLLRLRVDRWSVVDGEPPSSLEGLSP
jgi:hypothetical protein